LEDSERLVATLQQAEVQRKNDTNNARDMGTSISRATPKAHFKFFQENASNNFSKRWKH
jgi:hypothetical protein